METKKRINSEVSKVRSNLISIFLINTVVLFTLSLIGFIYLNSSSTENYRDVIKMAQNTKEVIQCFSTTGMGSLMLWVATKNSKTLEELLRRIQRWPNVTRTETQVILSSYKNSYKTLSKHCMRAI